MSDVSGSNLNRCKKEAHLIGKMSFDLIGVTSQLIRAAMDGKGADVPPELMKLDRDLHAIEWKAERLAESLGRHRVC